MPLLKTHGASVYYRDKGAGYPLLCLHGLGGSHQQTNSFFAGLDNTRLITSDHRGHGKSTFDAAEDISMETLCEDALALIDELRLDRFSIAGISLGAAISLKVALKEPKGLDRIILIRPAWINERSPANLNSLLTIADLIELHGLQRAKELWKESEPYRQALQHSSGLSHSLMGQFEREQAVSNPVVFRKLIHDRPFASFSVLKSIQQQVLIISSSDDPLHPLYHGQLLNEALPNCALYELVSKYHDPQAFAWKALQLVQAFLRDVT